MLKLILADNQAIFRGRHCKGAGGETEIAHRSAGSDAGADVYGSGQIPRAAVLVGGCGLSQRFCRPSAAGAQQGGRRVWSCSPIPRKRGSATWERRAWPVVYRNVTSAALVDCVRKVARGETWVQDVALPSGSRKRYGRIARAQIV